VDQSIVLDQHWWRRDLIVILLRIINPTFCQRQRTDQARQLVDQYRLA